MNDGVKETVAAAAGNADGAVAPDEVRQGFLALALGSVGVVYGDIGTSPLYAFREAALAASSEHMVSRGVVLGVLSLILWALIIVVTLKYVLVLLRADNNGEGGTLSLTALASRALGRRTAFVFVVGIIGASMFLGDSVITPAISVLSAVEGMKLANPAFGEFVAPLTVVILIVLFAAQSRGTAKVAALFGPIMVVWFVAIAVAGGLHIRDDPRVLAAINPLYGIEFFYRHGEIGLVTLGAVFLVVTGGEALYADLGHFGRKPIQTAWMCLVLPALLINYFGQGAKVLADPAAIENPFYRLVPEMFLLPMVVLATAATVIASQAVITGAYSLVHQAIQLGLLPRLTILHTSASHAGQIYIPRVTIALLVVTALGIVGLASFWVAQRRRTIGVRRALGATRRDILHYFQTENFLLATIGIVLGMVLAYGINLFLMAHYELPRLPAVYFPVGAVALWVIGQLAVLGPALRAAAVPPVVATRSV